ncbi:cation efflux family-domain-containing protein [Obelidium mucronatum]|nr:cation efflux family-domain-containing protein [Obelidium mucronatum]
MPTSASQSPAERLFRAGGFTFFFFIVEFSAGWYCGSMAIVSEAMTLLVDVLGFLVAFTAVKIAERESTNEYTWGLKRAEIIGALITILLNWILALGLFEEGFFLLQTPEPVEAHVMLITASVDLVRSVAMILLLKGPSEHVSSSYEQVEELPVHLTATKYAASNINVMVAVVNTIADLMGSLSIVLAALLLLWKPDWVILDPLCTLLVGTVTLLAPFALLGRNLRVLLEGTPMHLDIEAIKSTLLMIPAIKNIDLIRVWSLTEGRDCCAVVLSVCEDDIQKIHVLESFNEKSDMGNAIHVDTVDWSLRQKDSTERRKEFRDSYNDVIALVRHRLQSIYGIEDTFVEVKML